MVGALVTGGEREPAPHQRWQIRGCEMCLSYQNWASRRDSQGNGSHAAHLGPTQLILIFPSAVRFSTGRCTSTRRRRVSATVCISPHCQLGQGFERRRAERKYGGIRGLKPRAVGLGRAQPAGQDRPAMPDH
jgi:hypothetical protein